MALGVTMQLPVEDKHNYSRDYLNDQIAILLGGRLAEEITMNGAMTTGAGNDLERSPEMVDPCAGDHRRLPVGHVEAATRDEAPFRQHEAEVFEVLEQGDRRAVPFGDLAGEVELHAKVLASILVVERDRCRHAGFIEQTLEHPIDPGEPGAGDDLIRPLVTDHRQRVGAGAGDRDVEADLAQQPRDGVTGVEVVLDDDCRASVVHV